LGILQKILVDSRAEFAIGINENDSIFPDDGSGCPTDERTDCEEVYSIQLNIFITITPKAPTDLTAIATGSTEVTTTWVEPTPVPDAVDFYELTRATDALFTVDVTLLSTEFEVDPLSTTFVDSGLTTGITYFYEVRGHNVNGFGDPSNTDSATPGAGGADMDITVADIEMTGKPKNKVKDVRATAEVVLKSDNITPIEAASVRINWLLDTGGGPTFFLEEVALTGANGKVQFQITNAPDGIWTAVTVEVIPPVGFTWDNVLTPSSNSIEKPTP